MIGGSSPSKASKVGFGSVVGLFTSTVMKIILQIVMIVLFIIWVVRFA